MKVVFVSLIALMCVLLTFGCITQNQNEDNNSLLGDNNGLLVGNDKDSFGCIPSAGYSWCAAKQKCIRPWEEACEATICTMDALICPDGSGVGRGGPNCEFAPCPNCTCPNESWVLKGDMCIPKCAIPITPDAPICNLAGMKCTLTQEGTIGGNQGLANPASTNCIDHNGSLQIVDTSEGQVGMCALPSGKVCEEWAYFRGECTE